jgi:hypothetical protein
MKAKVSVILEHAVTIGVTYGLRRYYKHREDSPEERDLLAMADSIAEHVMDEIETWFDTSGGKDV